jgi:hypothetical protein
MPLGWPSRVLNSCDTLAEMIENDAQFYADLGDDPKPWLPIVAEMREATLPRRSVRSTGKTHAFANDRTDIDLLGRFMGMQLTERRAMKASRSFAA